MLASFDPQGLTSEYVFQVPTASVHLKSSMPLGREQASLFDTTCTPHPLLFCTLSRAKFLAINCDHIMPTRLLQDTAHLQSITGASLQAEPQC